ncbi:alpha/beta fold hydrolase [Lyngbya confervoides]|uniref:Alpha/beta fold hydrolase n=1 Tax=Lyngbya confervoides BDU141951 TaxID=1574623 RepID=A0ABD4T7P6_9CYAN|nr:alpha/beta fold hydrolase [Lyngbya confervoides]MCM1984488.1 alpha/beta fold hydrolase [Lyngbya confervoides BDU141951]
MFAKIRETQIYFDVEGSALVPEGNRMREKPVAFIVHGGPGVDHSSYKPTFGALYDQLQLVYFDHRGQGRSARGPRESYTLENNVEDMEALRQYLGLEKIVVIGTSYGGKVALTYAARYPQQVSHLVAIATSASAGFLDKAQATLARIGTPAQRAIAQRLWAGNFEHEAQLREYFEIMGPLYSRTYKAGTRSEAWDRTIHSVEAINVAFGGFLREFDIRQQLPRITAPTLVLGARHDWICAPEFSEEIAAAVPQAELIIFENSGHMIRADEPEAMIAAIARFLAQHPVQLSQNQS